LGIALDRSVSVRPIVDQVFFEREDGKTIYSKTLTGSAVGSVATSLDHDTEEVVREMYTALRADRQFREGRTVLFVAGILLGGLAAWASTVCFAYCPS
jgi:hypothetical protein